MGIKIVHFSKTPLAGAPIRLVQALRQHTNYTVHLIDLQRWGIFDHDVIHAEDPEYALSLAEEADIVHLHDCLDYCSQEFYPINFESLRKQGKKLVRHFHSSRQLIARYLGIGEYELLDSPMPSIVIAQYPERYFPKSRVVPNIIPQDSHLYTPKFNSFEKTICFSPSKTLSAWDGSRDYVNRWATKGATETIDLIKRVAQQTDCRVELMTGKPLAAVMEAKQQATLIIDELITGSYHLSGLEGLSVGRPVLAFLDNRTIHTLQEISGSTTCPFINVRLEDAYPVLVNLLNNPDEVKAIGRASRSWIDQYWSDKFLVQHFVDVYEKLLVDPSLIVRQESLRLDDRATYFQFVTLPDSVYFSRANQFQSQPQGIGKVKKQLKSRIVQLRQWFKHNFPVPLVNLCRKGWQIIQYKPQANCKA